MFVPLNLALLWFSLLVSLGLSYGVRHMHSIVPYYLIEPMLFRATYVLLILLSCLVLAQLLQDVRCMLVVTILFSVSPSIARYALSLKYRGSGDPNIHAVQSKALYSLARI